MLRNFPNFTRNTPASPEELQRMEALARAAMTEWTDGADMDLDQGGIRYRIPESGQLFARLTAKDPSRPGYYSWKRLVWDGDSLAWAESDDELAGQWDGGGAGPLYEIHGDSGLFADELNGDIVEIWPLDDGLTWGCDRSRRASGGTIDYADTTINLNAGSVFLVNTGGIFRLNGGSVEVRQDTNLFVSNDKILTLQGGDASALVLLFPAITVSSSAVTFDASSSLTLQGYFELCGDWAFCYDSTTLASITASGTIDISSIRAPIIGVPINGTVNIQGVVRRADGQRVLLRNTGSSTGTVKNLDPAAAARNRIKTPSGGDLAWAPGQTLELQDYPDVGIARFEVVGGTAVAAAALSGAGTADFLARWASSTSLAAGSGKDDGTTLQASKRWRTNETTPAPTGGTVNDYDAGDTAFAFLTPSSAMTVTGLANGVAGRHLLLLNRSGTNTLTLKHLDSGSSTTNQIVTRSGGDLVLAQNGYAHLVYEGERAKWVVVWQSDVPVSGVGAPSSSVGSAGEVYFDVADPTNPLLYVRT